MRRNSLVFAFLFNVLLLAPTAFAASYSGFATLDFTSLTMSGIDFTQSNLRQGMQAEVREVGGATSSTFAFSNDWGDSSVNTSLPSLGSASGSASSAGLSSSLSLLPSQISQSSGLGHADRDVFITALSTGVLSVSIPYQIHHQGSGEFPFFNTEAILEFNCVPVFCTPKASHAVFSGFDQKLGAFNETKTGILSLSLPMTQGQIGNLDFDTRVIAFVPEPDTLWLLAIGSFLMGLVRWRRSMSYRRVSFKI